MCLVSRVFACSCVRFIIVTGAYSALSVTPLGLSAAIGSDGVGTQATWPEAKVISNQCGDDELFLCFYRELRNRHMFATTSVSHGELLDARAPQA